MRAAQLMIGQIWAPVLMANAGMFSTHGYFATKRWRANEQLSDTERFKCDPGLKPKTVPEICLRRLHTSIRRDRIRARSPHNGSLNAHASIHIHMSDDRHRWSRPNDIYNWEGANTHAILIECHRSYADDAFTSHQRPHQTWTSFWNDA
jgi:hypothetical protein